MRRADDGRISAANARSPSPDTALHLALWTTIGGVAAGTAFAASGAGEGVLLGAVALIVAPSLGHFYAGETGHGVWMSVGRGALAFLAVGSLAVGAFQCFDLGLGERSEPCEPSSVPFVLAAVFATGAVGMAVYDIVDAPDAARRTQERSRKRTTNFSLAPAIHPGGGAGLVMATTF